MRGRLTITVVLLVSMAATAALARSLLQSEADAELSKAKAAADNYQVEEAVSIYTKAIDSGRLSPQQLATAYHGRGEARESYTTAYGIRDEEMLLALRDYQKALEIRPTLEEYRAEAGALIALGAYADATAAYRDALGIERPLPHWSLIGFARVERIKGRYDAAMAHLDEALRLWGAEQATMPIYYHRGRVLFLQEKFGAAAESFGRGIRQQTDFPAAFEVRACSHARLGEFAKAVDDMEHSIELSKAAPVNEAWEKTPFAKSYRQGQTTNLALIKAMEAGTATEADRSKLCRGGWNYGEDFRTLSPLFSSGANSPRAPV